MATVLYKSPENPSNPLGWLGFHATVVLPYIAYTEQRGTAYKSWFVLFVGSYKSFVVNNSRIITTSNSGKVDMSKCENICINTSILMRIDTHTHTHTYIHTRAHTRTYTYIHTHAHTRTYTYTHTHTHTPTHTYTYTYTHTHTPTY